MPGYDGLELDNRQGVLPVIRQRSSGACPRPGGEAEPVEPFRGRQALQSAALLHGAAMIKVVPSIDEDQAIG